jgi:ATP-dependent RNA helicase UAP56/SUB2
MGKTAVFVLSILNQLAGKDDSEKKECSCIVVCHTRELAYQIHKDFKRFGQFISKASYAKFYGGVPIEEDIATIEKVKPQAIVITPGRLIALTERKKLKL